MTRLPPSSNGTGIEAYLDGSLDARQRAEFELRLAADGRLRDELRLQEQIDGILRQRFVPPPTDAILGDSLADADPGPVSIPIRKSSPVRAWRNWTIAASILLLLGAGNWFMWREYGPRPRRSTPAPTLASVYRDTVAAGFKADWLCENDRQFASTFWKQFGQGLMVRSTPTVLGSAPTVQWNGISYRRIMSGNTLMVLAHADGQPVMVFVDSVPAPRQGSFRTAHHTGCGNDANLRHYERTVGNLHLYEVTPLDGPRLLDLFYDPQHPPEWYANPNG